MVSDDSRRRRSDADPTAEPPRASRTPGLAPPPRVDDPRGGEPRPGAPRAIVVDDPAAAPSLVAALGEAGFDVRAVASAEACLAALDEGGPTDVVLAELRLPGAADGVELLERLRTRDGAPRAVLTPALDDCATVRRALAVRVHGYVPKSGAWVGRAVDAARDAAETARAARERDALLEQARLNNARLRALNDELEILASTDALTGVCNRRHVDRTLEEQMALRDDVPFAVSLLLLDIDHFKRINDEHGHEVGDEVLRRVALTLLATLRPADVVGRYGGEEFLIALVGVAPEVAMTVAGRVLGALGAIELEHEARAVRVGASIGVAGIDEGAPSVPVHDLVRGADVAMYGAKNGGRNRAVLGVPTPRAATY